MEAIQRNKWENQKINKYFIKKHKGVSSRQHKFPKTSSNSTNQFVRNWAKISSLRSRVKHINDCNDFCQRIPKNPQKLEDEMTMTRKPRPTLFNECTDGKHKTFSTVTLAQYLDPILSENDEMLQIAIQKSFDSYSAKMRSTKNSNHCNKPNSISLKTICLDIFNKFESGKSFKLNKEQIEDYEEKERKRRNSLFEFK